MSCVFLIMSDSSPKESKEKSPAQTINELLQTNLPLIQHEITKLRQDAKLLVSKTIDLSPAQVNIVKLSEQKIVIELNLNQPQEQSDSGNEESTFDDSNESPDSKRDSSEKPNDGQQNDLSIGDNRSALKSIESDTTLKTASLSRRVCRSLSESDGESASSAKPKGILKYPKGWKKRTLSECSFEGLHSLTDDADDPDDKDASCGDLSEPESVGKSTKKVTFNQKVFKSVFKKNSLIGSLKKPRKDSKVKEARKKAGQVDLKVTENGEENDRNVTNSMTTEGSVKESHQKDSKQSLEMITKPEQVLTVDKDSVDSIEANNADNEWEEVRSKKSRSRRKRTDSRSSDHSECEDNGITEKPMCMLKEIRMHAVPQIEVK